MDDKRKFMEKMLDMMADMGDDTAKAQRIKMEIVNKWYEIIKQSIEKQQLKNQGSIEEFLSDKDSQKLVDFFIQVNMETDLFMKENGYKYEK